MRVMFKALQLPFLLFKIRVVLWIGDFVEGRADDRLRFIRLRPDRGMERFARADPGITAKEIHRTRAEAQQ